VEPANVTTAKRTRLAPEVRRAQIVSLAAEIALERGSLPVPLGELAEAASASKALIYAYFPTQYDLFNAVLTVDFDALARAGIEDASAISDLNAAALACAGIYFEHVAAKGPIAHLILRDLYMRAHISPPNRAFRDRIAGRLIRAGRRQLHLGLKEAVGAFNLAMTIPEEAGLLVYSGDTQRDVGRDLALQLVQSTLVAFAPEAGAPRIQGEGER
jgi:AcrR family transcriptional regulator